MLLISQNLKRVLDIFFWWTLDFVYYNSSRLFLFEIWFLTSLKEIIISMLHQRNTVRKYIFQKKKKKIQKIDGIKATRNAFSLVTDVDVEETCVFLMTS